MCYPPFEPQAALDVDSLVGQIGEDKECGFIHQVLVHPSLAKHSTININMHLDFKSNKIHWLGYNLRGQLMNYLWVATNPTYNSPM